MLPHTSASSGDLTAQHESKKQSLKIYLPLPHSQCTPDTLLLLSLWTPKTLEHFLAVQDQCDSPHSLPLISHL